MRLEEISPRVSWIGGTAFNVAVAVILGLASLVRAGIAPVTFAQFTEPTTQPSVGEGFAYNDLGAGMNAQLETTDGSNFDVPIPVTFNYLTMNSLLPPALRGPISALLTLTSTTSQPASVQNNSGQNIGGQAFGGDGFPLVTDVLSITLPPGQGLGAGGLQTNLLTMRFTAQFVGVMESTNPTLSGSTSIDDTVTYTSDFMTFAPNATNRYDIGFSSWNTTSDNHGLELSSILGDTNFGSATAAGAGTFDTFASAITVGASVLPEPTGWSLAGFGTLALLAGRRAAAPSVSDVRLKKDARSGCGRRFVIV